MKTTVMATLGLLFAAPCAAQNRWQLTLKAASISGTCSSSMLDRTALLVRQADTTVTVPVSDIPELRLVAKAMKQTGRDDGGRAVFSALSGAGDEVYTLTLADLPERLGVVWDVLRAHPPTSR
ncbi:MAG: hypothetical protein ACREMM_11980 [Gemmatimonadales bacterium]